MDDRTLRVLEYDKIVSMLAEQTVSAMGREIALKTKPFKIEKTIVSALKETNEALMLVDNCGSGIIYSFVDIRPMLKRVEIGASLSISELLGIGKVLGLCKRIRKEIDSKKILQNLETIAPTLTSIEPIDFLNKEIMLCIESEERISDNASVELAAIRRQIVRCNEKIRERLNGIISSPQYQKYLQEPIVTIRSGRYVVPVKQEYRTSIKGFVHDQSSSGATVFIEPMSVFEANNDLRELKMKEEQEVERILARLSTLVFENSSSLQKSLISLAKLDFLIAKARLSLSMDAVCPQFTGSQRLSIIKGRHPLINKDKVVPIDMSLGIKFKILIITGPNTGGKTVTLKTVGLFVLMTQSGLNIPASIDSEIGLFNNVYADIGDEQSIEQSLSTFSSHMMNIAPMIKNSDNKTLLLFDELGAGTDPVEGAALAMAILDYLKEKKTLVMATTHYSELKAFALLRDGIENASTEFDLDTLKPTYRLFVGIPGRSNAFEISKRLGLDPELIDKAKTFISRENMKFDEIIGNIEENRLRTQYAKEEAETELKKARKLSLQLDTERDKLADKHKEIINKAKEEASEIIAKAKLESEEVIKTLRHISFENESAKKNILIQESRNKLSEALAEIGKNDSIVKEYDAVKVTRQRNFKLGEFVYIKNLDKHGYILDIKQQAGEVILQVGILKVTSKITEIRKAKENELKETLPQKRLVINSKSVSPEISVRGQKLEEALLNIEKYIDDAVLSGYNEVTIIHGKGMGILRNGVHDLLKSHPAVSEYRLGRYGEGDYGVTIVTLSKG